MHRRQPGPQSSKGVEPQDCGRAENRMGAPRDGLVSPGRRGQEEGALGGSLSGESPWSGPWLEHSGWRLDTAR